MTSFNATMPNINNTTRDPYNYDRALGYATAPRVAATTVRSPQSVRVLPASPAGVEDEPIGASPAKPSVDQQNRAAGFAADRQADANKYANNAFKVFWDREMQGVDINNNESLEKLGEKYGVKRGNVGIGIALTPQQANLGIDNPDLPPAMYNPKTGLSSRTDYHTMSPEEYAAAIKSRALEQFNAKLQTGQTSQVPASPASPVNLFTAAPGTQGPEHGGGGGVPASPGGIDPSIVQGYQQTLAGTRPDQAGAVARRLGMQPYDVQQQQNVAQAQRNATDAMPGQYAAQNQLMNAQTGLVGAQAGETAARGQLASSQATTLVPAQAAEATGKGLQAVGEGAKASAQATGAMLPDQYKKQIDDLTTKHQAELQALNMKLAAAQEQLRIARGGKEDPMGAPSALASGTPAAPAPSAQAAGPAQAPPPQNAAPKLPNTPTDSMTPPQGESPFQAVQRMSQNPQEGDVISSINANGGANNFSAQGIKVFQGGKWMPAPNGQGQTLDRPEIAAIFLKLAQQMSKDPAEQKQIAKRLAQANGWQIQG